MLIVASIYLVLIWLVFFKLKFLPWNRYWGSLTTVLGLLLLAVVVGALNFFTPTGRITVQGKVVEITPNVSGAVTELFVTANTAVRKGAPLFQIDPEQFQHEVDRLEAALVEANHKVIGLRADMAIAKADVKSRKHNLSSMPEDTIDKLSRSELRDLVEFLLSQQSGE